MQESAGARNALLRFYEAFTAAVPGDMQTFERVFSRKDGVMVIGTAAPEWVDNREKGTQSWGMEGIGIEPGEPRGWEQDSVAWAVDRPSFVMREARMPIRILAVFLKEDGDWKLVSAHFSVGVPDEVAMEHAVEWTQPAAAH